MSECGGSCHSWNCVLSHVPKCSPSRTQGCASPSPPRPCVVLRHNSPPYRNTLLWQGSGQARQGPPGCLVLHVAELDSYLGRSGAQCRSKSAQSVWYRTLSNARISTHDCHHAAVP
eukprot:PhF_6_TR37456/c0_g1_i2/m.55107